MTYEIWACEPDYLIGYLDKEKNFSASDLSGFNLPVRDGILSVDGDTATIAIEGLLTREGPSIIAQLFGYKGTSYNALIEAVENLPNGVTKIKLKMDTPGGAVDGVDDVYSALKNSGKKITAVNMGNIASAGLWIASAADEIVAQNQTVQTGSIGIIITQTDRDKANEKRGIVTTVVKSENAGKKNPDAGTSEGLKVIQAQADALERVFISRVAAGRNVTEEKVKADFGQGAMMIAQDPDDSKPDALSVGLIDCIDSKCDKFKALAESVTDDNPAPVGAEQQTGGNTNMDTLAKLIAENPTLAAEVEKIKTEAKQGGREEVEKVVKYASTFAGPDSKYPASIKKVALECIAGEISQDVLRGAVIAYDALTESKNTEKAQAKTKEIGETTGQDQAPVAEDGSVNTEADYQQAIADGKKLQGRG